MTSFWGNSLIAYPLIAILIFVVVYLNAERTLAFLHKNSLGQREEIMRHLDLMFVEINKKKLTITLLLCSFGIGGLFFILFWPNLLLGLLFGLTLTILGWMVPKFLVKALYEKRCNRFVDQMVDGMTIMSNGISSGLSVPQSMDRVVENLGNPMSQEFNLALSQMRLGMSLEETLVDLSERIPRPDVQMFVTSVNILKETGGNLAETFQTITTTVRERQKVEKKIQALTAQGITQGVIITLVPFFLMITIFFFQPDYIMPMFNTTLGIVFLFVMLVFQIIGAIAIKKIVTIKV
jgi:tight adherence protein B